MKLIPVRSPDGSNRGWISPALIVAIDSSGRYFEYIDRDRISTGTIPCGVDDDLVLRACGLKHEH